MTHPVFGGYWRRDPPIRNDGCERASPDGAPAVGQHTLALLAELGYSPEACAEPIEFGVVRANRPASA